MDYEIISLVNIHCIVWMFFCIHWQNQMISKDHFIQFTSSSPGRVLGNINLGAVFLDTLPQMYIRRTSSRGKTHWQYYSYGAYIMQIFFKNIKYIQYIPRLNSVWTQNEGTPLSVREREGSWRHLSVFGFNHSSVPLLTAWPRPFHFSPNNFHLRTNWSDLLTSREWDLHKGVRADCKGDTDCQSLSLQQGRLILTGRG